ILQILYRIASYFLLYLRQIDKKSLMIEKKLHKSMKNKELILLLSLEKSLVYFSTSLKANEITLEKMLKLDIIQKYPEDQDVLEDVIIENKQAIEMANIYSNILSGTMDAFASVISNNLNIVMKFLASITIVMSIPNIIFGSFGMNVNGIPFNKSAQGFWLAYGVTAILCIICIIILKKKDLF
ncbi:magnesium transporter, partial [Clostridium tepidum]